MAHAVATLPSPSASRRLLGLAGILGGAVLLAAFVVDIAPDLNNVRLILFNLGAIAVVVAHRQQVAASLTLVALVAGATVLANVWYLSMVVLSIDRPNPFGGGFGLEFFWAAIAMWLSDAAFGVVILRLGAVTRWGAAALAIGSLLTFTGIDRLALTSPENPTIFGPVSLIGIALNGLGWILLGLDVATRAGAPAARPPGPL